MEFVAQFAHSDLALELVSGGAFRNPFSFIVLDLHFEALNFRAVTVGSLPGNLNVSSLSNHSGFAFSNHFGSFRSLDYEVGRGVLTPAPSVLSTNSIMEYLIGGEVSMNIARFKVIFPESDKFLPLRALFRFLVLKAVGNDCRATVQRVPLLFPLEDD